MKRSEFLAFIPSIAAIPFIGKEIIKGNDKITIIEPTPAEVDLFGESTSHGCPDIAPLSDIPCGMERPMQGRVKFQMVVDDMVVGEANMTEICLSDGRIDEISNMYYDLHFTHPRVEVRASFNHNKVMEHFHWLQMRREAQDKVMPKR